MTLTPLVLTSLALLPFQDQARPILDLSIEAMGGRSLLSRIAVTQSKGVSHSFMPEQSERPDGPFFAIYTQFDETCEFAPVRRTVRGRASGLLFPEGAEMSFVFENGRLLRDQSRGFVPPAETAATPERLALGPERLLLLAYTAPTLTKLKDTVLQGVPHHVVGFAWGSVPVKVFLNKNTYLPTAVETLTIGSGFWSVWGDVRTRTLYSNWELKRGGLRFPTLWSIERNGFHEKDISLTNVAIQLSPAAVEPFADPPLPPAPFTAKEFKPVEVAPGITQFPGPYNTAVIEQQDGLIILEGVMSSEFTEAFFDQLKLRYPKKRVKAVVTTSDAWPHLGGLRPFVARGIPVVAHPLNQPILERLITSPRTLRPDSLATKPQKPKFTLVNQTITFGRGEEAVTVYPIRGEGSERMLMVHVPAKKVLYGSDLIQPMPDGTFYFPQYLDELVSAATREGLSVETVFAMHSAPRSWKSLVDFLAGLKETRDR